MLRMNRTKLVVLPTLIYRQVDHYLLSIDIL